MARMPDDDEAAAGGPRLLIATFRRLFWYFPATDRHRVVHEGLGKYYGLAASGRGTGGLRRIHVVSRPRQDRDDSLLLVEHARGEVLETKQLHSRGTHQVLRDGDVLFVTDTRRGNVYAYELPGLRLRHTYDRFTHGNHVNSLYVEGLDLYVLCHNNGKSFLARLDLRSGEEIDVFPDVGERSHDIVPWEDSFLICDSYGGGLIRVDRETKACRTLHADEGHFTKGLVEHAGVAYFATSTAATREERFAVNCDLVAFDLRAEEALWRRPIPSNGLVNAIASARSLRRAAAGAATMPGG